MRRAWIHRVSGGRRLAIAVIATLAALALPAIALAHLERPSYWPDPAADTSVSPPAGGEVPDARSLKSALKRKPPGKTRVVCKGQRGEGKKSLRKARRSIKQAKKKGFRLLPSRNKKELSKKKAKRLMKINRKLADRCKFKTVQKAINKSGNNDRVVVMPGKYKEKPSRNAPVNDPKCAGLTQEDQSGAETPSYRYQVTCPNDQNLIYVQGRALTGPPLDPPRDDRQGIPAQELGPCLRCNLQIEGSGPKPEDVILDGGLRYQGKGPEAKPRDYAKHVVMRVDRADGFVGRNMLLRGALEHGFYAEEVDGILLDRTKFFWAADYGHLTFTTDHNMIKNCEGFGAGDAAIYPGAAPETGVQADESFYPDAPRKNTVVKKCDLHGNVLAYSGSMGNAVRITDNQIYGNTNGISSDTLSAAGHPGYPADSLEVDNNYIYSNNLNLYTENPPVEPLIPMPIGTGIVWPGMNDGTVHDNWIFDNWRHGTVLLAVPDALAGDPEGNVNDGISCPTAPPPPPTSPPSTSCNNLYFDNHMGRAPAGFERPPGIHMFGNRTGSGGRRQPNGVDFWWDEFPGNTGNCWFDNTGPNGEVDNVTGSGQGVPPDLLPGRDFPCDGSVGNGDPVKEAILADCSTYSRGDTAEDHPLCYWFEMPAEPGSAGAQAQQRQFDRAAREYLRSPEAAAMQERLDEIAESSALADRP